MSPKRTQLIAAAVVVIAAIAMVVWLMSRGGSGQPVAGVIGPEVTATRVVANGQPTDAAYVSLPYLKNDDSLTVMNVAIDLNGDGQLAAYQTAAGQTQEEWVIRNYRAKVWGQGNTVGFDLFDRAADGAADLQLIAYLTAEPLDSLDQLPAQRAEAARTISAFQTDDYAKRMPPITDPERDGAASSDQTPGAPAGDGPTPGPMATLPKGPDAAPYLSDTTAGQLDGAPAAGIAPAADQLPPADQDFEVFHADVPDMLQGTNECVPTSTSNSLEWLGQRFGFSDRLPHTQRETMEELKGDLNWTADGVATRTDFVSGKTAFAARHNLPIYTHQIGGELDNDIGTKIAVELAKGQAVEVVIGFYEQDAETGEWTRHGGHMITGVGFWRSNGDTFLGVHDPGNPNDGMLDIHRIIGKRLYNYPYRGRYQVYVDRAFAESVTEDWISSHPPQTAIQTGGGMLELADLQNVWFIEALRIGRSWYPIKQFHKFTGTECDRAEHWHANTGTAWGLDLSRSDYFETNPETIRARQAPVVQWSDPEGCGAGKTNAVEVSNIMISRSEAGQLIAHIVQ